MGKHSGFFKFSIIDIATFSEPSALVQTSTIQRSLLLTPFVPQVVAQSSLEDNEVVQSTILKNNCVSSTLEMNLSI